MHRSSLPLLLAALLLSGCSVLSITANSVGEKASQSAELENHASPHKSVMVHGFLERTPADLEHNVLVVATNTQGAIASSVSVGKSGLYTLFLPQGEFLLSAFVDRNNDLSIAPSEIAGQIPRPLSILSAETRAHFGVDIHFTSAKKETRKFAHVIDEEIALDGGIPSIEPASELVSGRFGDENIRLGSEQSTTDFFNIANPLQYLDELDVTDDRTTIVFVHGIDDSPRVFEHFEGAIPRGKFQTLYYYYPSGARISYSSQLLHHIFLSGKVLPTDKHLVLAAHSMGGLVTRGSINELRGQPGESRVKLFTSFATPYAGVESANFAMTASPAIVPSWIDIASNSDYIRDLFLPLPPKTTFMLCVANKFGDGDGTIPLKSQKAPAAVAQASKVVEFPDTHVGIAADSAAIDQFTKWAEEFARPVVDHPAKSQQNPAAESQRNPAAESQQNPAAESQQNPATESQQNPAAESQQDPSAESQHEPAQPLVVGNLEKRRRADALLKALLRGARETDLDVRASVIAPTLIRFRFSRNDTSVIIQSAAGEGIRFDIPQDDSPFMQASWPSDEKDLDKIASDLLAAAVQRLAASPPHEPSKSAPAPVEQDAAADLTRKTPPFVLGTGVSLNLDPGVQHFALVTPFFMDMYIDHWGLGLDARFTVFAPIHQTPTANIKYDPFYLLSGPRFRWGDADALLAGTISINAGVALGRITLSEPGDPVRFPDVDELIRRESGARFLATSAFTLGVRIKRDFYAISRFEAGYRPSPVDVDVGAADLVRLNERVFGNIRLGVEFHVP